MRPGLAGLGLRISRPGPAWMTAGLLLLVYALTMARSLTFYDSAELALVAHQLGVGHPIGQPLHSLLGFVFAHLPGVSPHVGLTLMSALFGALCLLPAWSLSERLAPTKPTRMADGLRGLALLGVGIGLVAWEPATRVEVYTLAAFCALWATARLVSHGPSLSAGLALGLGAGAHAVIAAAQGLATLPIVLAWRERAADAGADADADADANAARRGILHALLGGLLGLGVFAYVPLAASRHPDILAWGAPTDGASLTRYLRGADYQHNQGIDLSSLFEHVASLAWWGATNGALFIGLLGLGATLWLASRAEARAVRALRWTIGIVIALDVGFVAANVVFHPDVPDYRGYFLAPLWMCAAGVAAAAARLAAESGRLRIYGAVCAALPLLAALASPAHLAGPRDDPSLAEVLARGALDESPRGAIVLVEADHWVAPLLYLQEAAGVRDDVVVVALGLSSSRWFWEHTYARHPELSEIPLEGPGGRGGRIQRLLGANPDRAVLIESVPMAAALGLRPCGVGFLLHTVCEEPVDPASATRAIAEAAPLRTEALEVAARVGEARGEALWRMGRAGEAARAWLAGLSASGLGPRLPEDLPEAGPPLRGPLPDWTRPAALHDPMRNLAITALLLDSVGHRAEALQLADAALAAGLGDAAFARAQILR